MSDNGAHYGDIPTGGTEIDVLPTNAAAYRVRLVVLRTRADNEILARIRTSCAGSDGYIAKNNIVGVVIVHLSTETFLCDLHRASVQSGGSPGQGSTGGTGSGSGSTGGTGSGTGSTYPVPMNDLLLRRWSQPLTRFTLFAPNESAAAWRRKVVQSVIERYQSRIKAPIGSAQL